MRDIHKPGGNYFNDMRIDYDIAFANFLELYVEFACKESVKQRIAGNFLYNRIKERRDMNLIKKGKLEGLILAGSRREWFEEFMSFWRNVLNGRPLNIMDFHMLRMLYRIAFQETEKITWSDTGEHEMNWKRDKNMALLFNQLYSDAINPIKNLHFIEKGDRVLEYGCSHAPYYRAYRKYYNHLKAAWTLADLKQISFLYSCYTYYKEDAVENLIIIDANNMDNSLCDVDGDFDVIILTTVLEHVHNPLLVVQMLLSRLRRGGKLVFDYIKSEASGLDSEAGLSGRKEALEYMGKQLEIISGAFNNLDESIGLCIGVKK